MDEEVSWQLHCHDYLGGKIFTTGFPSEYGHLSICKFKPQDILTFGKVFKESFGDSSLLLRIQNYNLRSRMFIKPGSIKADTKLSLDCCHEGDCKDWEAFSAFFGESELIAIASIGEKSIPKEMLKRANLKEIAIQEIENVSKDKGIIHYNGEGSPYKEVVRIINARSPKGKRLPDSYRDAINNIL